MKRILTHKKPDLDAIVSAWIAQEVLFAGEAAEVVFVSRNVSQKVRESADCVVDVGNAYSTERLWFDHKPPAFADRNRACAAKLLWEYLLRQGKDAAHLTSLVRITFEGDTRRPSDALRWSRREGPHAALARFAAESNDDATVYARMTGWLQEYRSSWENALCAAPEFGDRLPGRFYLPRPGAYAVLHDAQGRIAALQTPKGCYLPGGGAKPGETPAETLEREIREECGLRVRIVRNLGEAVEFVYAAEEETYFAKQGVFFEAAVGGDCGTTVEAQTTLLWLSLEEAAAKLTHLSQVWAVCHTCI